MNIKIVEAGVDSNHQIDHCDDCKLKFSKDPEELDYNRWCTVKGYERITTCSHYEYLTLCEKCYKYRGNSVR